LCLAGLVPPLAWWNARRPAFLPRNATKAGALADTQAELLSDPAAWAADQALWRDFRDLFGVVWSLRVIERVNEVARLQHWPCALTWHGLKPQNLTYEVPQTRQKIAQPLAASTTVDYSQARARLDQTWRTVLRRFVNETWIEQRLGRQLARGELPE
jgi:hypothetical protein